MPLRTYVLGILLLHQGALGQQTVSEIPNDQNTLDDFSFEDDLFEDAFNEPEVSTKSWRDGFTVLLSQQFFGQVSRHAVEPLPGVIINKNPGIENNRLGVNLRYQNAFSPGWLLQGSWQGRVYWKEDYEYEAGDSKVNAEYRVNELYLQRSFDDHSVKFGRQTVVWGETIGNSVLDVINHTEFRDFSIIDIEDARLNQWMLVWDIFQEQSSWSSFINLYPEFNPVPRFGGPFYFQSPFEFGDYKRSGDVLLEAGTQWRKSYEASDIAFMAAYLHENQLRYELPSSGFGEAIPVKNDFLLVGFSANRAVGNLLLNLDVAFSHGILIDNSSLITKGSINVPVNLKRDQIGISFGFEYGITSVQNISLGIQAKKMLDERDGLRPEKELLNEGVYGSWLLRFSNRVSNDDIVLSATMQGDLDGNSILASLSADMTINDHWKIGAQFVGINANKPSQLVFFDDDLRIGVTITYSF